MLDSRLNPIEANRFICERCGSFGNVAPHRFYSVAFRDVEDGTWCEDCYMDAVRHDNRMCDILRNKEKLDKISKDNKEIAARVGVSPRTVEGWKQGRKIKDSTLFKINVIIGKE